MIFFNLKPRKYLIYNGFTLLEIMIALMLISLISLIAIPSFRSIQNDQSLQAEAARVKSDIRYMQQIAFDTQNNCVMTYGNRSYELRLSGSPNALKSENLENNVVFQGSGTITMGKDGIPTSSVTITLTKNNLKAEVKIYAGGKIDIL